MILELFYERSRILVYVIYQTQKMRFDHAFKDREESWKYDTRRIIFEDLQGV